MELQQGLNNVIRERIAKRIQTGSMNAQEAVQRLISEGKVANDYIAYLGANNTRKSDVLFNSGEALEMQLGNDGVYTIHDNAIGQLGERFNIPSKYLRELAGGNEWQRNLASTILNQHSTWTHRTRTLVRTVGNEVRGVLSDSYRRLNSETIIMSFLETANRMGGTTCRRFYGCNPYLFRGFNAGNYSCTNTKKRNSRNGVWGSFIYQRLREWGFRIKSLFNARRMP